MSVVVKCRGDQQKVLQPHPDDDDAANHDHGCGNGFDLSVEQDQKRTDEADGEYGPCQGAPGGGHGTFDDVSGLFAHRSGLHGKRVPVYASHLGAMGKVDVVIKFGASPDAAGLNATMSLIDGLVLRGETFFCGTEDRCLS